MNVHAVRAEVFWSTDRCCDHKCRLSEGLSSASHGVECLRADQSPRLEPLFNFGWNSLGFVP